jgi:hypothetical protein
MAMRGVIGGWVCAILALAAWAAPVWAEEAVQRPLLDLIDAANKRMADLRQDATLMSAQKELRIAQETTDTRTFIESRVWPIDATVIDVTRSSAPGKFFLHLDAPQLGLGQVDFEEPLANEFVMGLNKGAKVKIFVRLTATLQGETLKLGLAGASVDEKRMVRTDPAVTETDRLAYFGIGVAPVVPAVTGTRPAPTGTSPAPSGKPEFRVNCGGPALVVNGVQWLADQPYSQANGWGYTAIISTNSRTAKEITLPVATPLPISPEMQKPYQTERGGGQGNLCYQFDVPNGKYTVKLGFCESALTGAGQRVFSVEVQGKMVKNDLDVFKLGGGRYKAVLLMYRPILVEEGKLVIRLVGGTKGVPMVNVIEVLGE